MQHMLKWEKSKMGCSPELGHCRDEDGVCKEENGEVDAVGGLSEEAAEGAGGKCFWW